MINQELFDKWVNSLKISRRAKNVLSIGISYILGSYDGNQLLTGLRNCGRKTADEITLKLGSKSLMRVIHKRRDLENIELEKLYRKSFILKKLIKFRKNILRIYKQTAFIENGSTK